MVSLCRVSLTFTNDSAADDNKPKFSGFDQSCSVFIKRPEGFYQLIGFFCSRWTVNEQPYKLVKRKSWVVWNARTLIYSAYPLWNRALVSLKLVLVYPKYCCQLKCKWWEINLLYEFVLPECHISSLVCLLVFTCVYLKTIFLKKQCCHTDTRIKLVTGIHVLTVTMNIVIRGIVYVFLLVDWDLLQSVFMVH